MMIALHQVRAVALTGFVEVARHVGVDPYRQLMRAGINPLALQDPEARIAASQIVGLIEETAKLSGCDGFGMLMIECRTFESLGPIALLLEQLGSVREAVTVTNDYRRHINDLFHFEIEAGDPTLIKAVVLPQFASNQVIDMVVAGTQLMLAGASRRRWRPDAVHFRHKAPASGFGVYRRFFPAPIQFGSSFDGFECAAGQMDAPWPWARPDMRSHAERLLEMVDIRPQELPVSDTVTRAIALVLPSGRATLPGVAANLGLNPRALQRTLEREGTTFGELLNKGRRELALRYLANGSQSVGSVAELTGYSSASAFSRWFASEFGVAPRSWREAHLNQAAVRAA